MLPGGGLRSPSALLVIIIILTVNYCIQDIISGKLSSYITSDRKKAAWGQVAAELNKVHGQTVPWSSECTNRWHAVSSQGRVAISEEKKIPWRNR